MKKLWEWCKRIMWIGIAVGLLVVLITGAINLFVVLSVSPYVLTAEEAAVLDADCVLVLGSRVLSDTHLSKLLEDRMLAGVALYESGAGRKLLCSGDHGRKQYDEVNAMRLYAQDAGVPEDDIFLDHAGFNTYDSMYRARDVFDVKTVVIVTQSFHMSRSLFAARSLGLEAYGVVAQPVLSKGSVYNDAREYLARVKDFFQCLIKPPPKYLGPVIPIGGSGTATFDR